MAIEPRRTSLSVLLLAATAIVAAAPGLHAQEFRGTVLGRISDPQGAAVPGVTVVVTNEKTSVGQATLTESDGAYAVPFLIPGVYRVEAEMPGFQKVARSGITVAIGQKVAVNIQLQVGGVSETLEVQGNASLLDTATGGLGQVIDRDRVESLPLNGRMIFMLNRTAPGVNWQVPTFGAQGTSGLRPFDNLGGSAWSLNGGRVGTNEFLLDGAPDSTRGRYNFAPPVDAVEEFKIQTNTYDAQYGRTGGGVVNMTLKSGTNELHGQAWDFLKDEAFNANNSLNNALGRPRPPYTAHQYGATVTGPIRRNKTFFMATFEGLRERVPFPITTSVPTAAERAGNFNERYTDQANPLVIYDPLTTRMVDGRLVRDPFPNNQIPANRIDPIARAILDLVYPLPNVAGQRLNNYANPINQAKYDYDAELLRIDHHFSAGSRAFLSLHRNHRDEFRSNFGLQDTFANQGEWPQTRENYGGTLDWVKTLGNKGLLNVRGGYTRFTQDTDQTDVKAFDRGQLGFQNLPGEFLPRINLEQFSDIGVGNTGRVTADKTVSFQSNYTHMFSRHTLKAGGEYRRILATPLATGNNNGFFEFTRAFTRRDPNSADATSGSAIASFLLGYPTNNSNMGMAQARDQNWNYFGLFVQDDLRVNRKLTLNLGLRWDYESGTVDSLDRLVRGYAFDQANPLADRVRNASGAAGCPSCANLQGGLLFAGVDGVSRQLFDPDRNNFQPRVGFAYTLNDRMVLRGGYGLYNRYREQLGNQQGFFVETPYIGNDLSGRPGVPETTLNTFGNPFPRGLSPAPGASFGLLTQVGRDISFDDPTSTIPYIHQWNLTFEREITRNFMAQLSYVGSFTGGLPVSKNINVVSAEDLARGAAYLQQTVPNPFAGLLPGSTINGSTVQRQQLLRPYPQFLNVTQNALAIGETRYHGLQLLLHKRMSHGLTLTSAYTYSKVTEKSGFLNAQDSEQFEQVTDYDRPHIWTFSGIYELPFGNGKALASDAKGFLEHVVGGWQFQWIFNWQSGRPLDFADATVNNLDLLRSPALDNPTPERWFSTCYLDTAGTRQKCLEGEEPAFRQRPNFTLRTMDRRLAEIRVPFKPTLDASLFKNIRVNHRFRVELRFEAFNVLNSTIFPNPNTDFTSANFGKIPDPKGTVYFPRNVQLGMKVYF